MSIGTVMHPIHMASLWCELGSTWVFHTDRTSTRITQNLNFLVVLTQIIYTLTISHEMATVCIKCIVGNHKLLIHTATGHYLGIS